MANPVLKAVIDLPGDGENPTIGTAFRLTRPGISPLLFKDGNEITKSKWDKFIKDITNLQKEKNEFTIAQYYVSQPWAQFREIYKHNKPELREDRYFTIKAAPRAGH